jgi:DNA-binding NarL/FixJ family response regulator
MINAIRGEVPDAKIIVLTTYKGDVQIRRALKAGAQGYLLENTLHKELQRQSEPFMPEERHFLPKPPTKSPSMRRMTL